MVYPLRVQASHIEHKKQVNEKIKPLGYNRNYIYAISTTTKKQRKIISIETYKTYCEAETQTFEK